MTDLTMNEIGMQELTVGEIEEVSGGLLCVFVLVFGAGYAVGTAIYNAIS